MSSFKSGEQNLVVILALYTPGMSSKLGKVTFLNSEPCMWHDSMTTQAGLPSSIRNDSQSCWARVFLKVKGYTKISKVSP